MRNRGKWLGIAAVVAVSVAVAVPSLTIGAPTLLTADLKGNNEVPDEGDNNGKGTADITLKRKARKVCFNIEHSKLTDATAAHIHRGVEGVAGGIKVELFAPAAPLAGEGAQEGCVTDVKRKLIRRIKRNPARYYVNVHSSDFPNGAIRGQLEPTA